MRRRPSDLPALLFGVSLCVFVVAHGCADASDSDPEDLCFPGENIFCRCPGGDPGTKPCLANGKSFGDCEPCEPRDSTGPGQQSSSSSSSGAGGDGGNQGVGGFGGGPTGNSPLLAACGDNAECQTGACVDSFCTMMCTTVSECPYPSSECVPYKGSNICMPTCQTAVDCTPFNAPVSACGFTKAIDNWDVTVCADWGEAHQIMPPGTDCLPFDHAACNLGYQQLQSVCTEQGVCAKGCFVNADCPMGTTCNGGGSLGNCM